MTVEAHIICWNESDTIHLTIRHYQQFCSHIIIYDNYSTDNTPEIAKSMGCEVKQFGIKGILSDVEYTKLKNSVWKGSKADWVIVCDADEILDIKYFDFIGTPTILRTFGWNVFHKDMPSENWLEIKTGVYDSSYSKMICFKPSDIKEINYIHGCHVANPIGNIKYSMEIFTLFHYRNVGGITRLCNRHSLYRQRLSEWNKRWKCGLHYEQSDYERTKYYLEKLSESTEFNKSKIYI